MNKIQKIICILIVCFVFILIPNVSFAGWKQERWFRLPEEQCTKHNNCTIYHSDSKAIHIGPKGYKSRSAKLVLDKDKGILCLQHNKESPGDFGDASEIQYKITMQDNYASVTPISDEAKENSSFDELYNSAWSARVAYILSFTSDTASQDERYWNGTQGALWKVIPHFWEELQQKTEFSTGEGDQNFASWTNTEKSQAILAESSAYKAFARNQPLTPTKGDTTVKVAELNSNYYIIGPFSMTYAKGDYTKDNGTVVKFGGFLSASLIMNNTNVGDWSFCDSSGNYISEPYNNGSAFYIKVNKSATKSRGSLNISVRRMRVSATIFTVTDSTGKQERAIITSARRYWEDTQVTFDFNALANLTIVKKDTDDSNIVLPGVKFKIKNSAGYYLKTGNSSETGTIDFSSIGYTAYANQATEFITDARGQITINNMLVNNYTIEETSVGNRYGYNLYAPNISWYEGNTNLGNGTQSIQIFLSGNKTITVKNKKQVGTLSIIKVDDRNTNKVLPGVEFVIRSFLHTDQYIKVKATGNNVTNAANGWATRIVGTSRVNDTSDKVNNPTLQYTSNKDEATVFVTDANGIISIQNLLASDTGSDTIQYKLIETYNANYGYLANYQSDWIPLNQSTVTHTAPNHQEYIRLEGNVWEEIAVSKSNFVNNLLNDSDASVKGIKVYLYKDGQLVTTRETDANGWYGFGTRRPTGEGYQESDYTTIANGDLKIDDLASYHIEFEYDGLRFTSVLADTNYSSSNYSITSKAEETASGRSDRKDRQSVNADFTEIINGETRNGTKNYELNYNFDNHVSTYKDHWKYNGKESLEEASMYPTNSNGKKYLTSEEPSGADYAVIASTQTSEFNIQSAYNARFKSDGADTITGVNLGIQRREQPDLAVSTDIDSLNLVVQDYENTYTYKNKEEYEDQNENDPKYDAAKDGFGVDVKFGNKYTTSYSNRGLKMYTRRIYESDLALYNQTYETNKDLLQIYVTYKIALKNQAIENQSIELTSTVNELVNYYDSRYTIVDSWIVNGDNATQIGANAWSNTSKYGNSYNDNGLIAVYTQATSNIKIGANGEVDVYIKFRLNPEAVKALIEKQTTLNNISEITSFSTMTQTNNVWAPYAGIDEDSNPGSVKSIEFGEDKLTEVTLNGRKYDIETKTLDETYYEDDTEAAPSLIIGIDEKGPTRGLSGTVFEDEDALHDNDATHPGEERTGDGILYTGEGTYKGPGPNERIDRNRVSGAKVELLEYDETTTDHIAYNADGTAKVATLYELSVDDSGILSTTTKEAVTETNENGEYQITGVIPGRYLIRYTYNNNCYITDSDGNPIEQINVRDYKSTIITSDLMKVALNLDKKYSSEDERMGDLNWILKYDNVPNNGISTSESRSKSKDLNGLIRYSDATDDVSKRDEMDDLYFGTYGNNYEMTADTAFFDVGVEYSEVGENPDGYADKISYTDYKDEYNLENGKILVLDENFMLKIVDTFYAVNPYQDFGISERARQDYSINKRISNLKITLANGQVLINGNPYKQLPANPTDIDEYWNNLEAPSDEPLPYIKALPGEIIGEIDNEIIQGATLNIEYTITIRNKSEKDYHYEDNQEYYYYGTNRQGEIKTAVRKVVDYMDDTLDYDDKTNEALGWTKITPEELRRWDKEDETDIPDDPGYKQLISDEVYEDIKQGYTVALTENFYGAGQGLGIGQVANMKIYASKVLTTSESGTVLNNHTEIVETMGIRSVKGSTPGNYSPKKVSPNEQDDDMTKIIITPPTGLVESKIFIISATAIALLILAGGIYIIKKKVLD